MEGLDRLSGRQLRDLAGLALMAVGAVATCVAAFMVHPAAGVGLTGVWLIGAGWLLASAETPPVPAPDPGLVREGGR